MGKKNRKGSADRKLPSSPSQSPAANHANGAESQSSTPTKVPGTGAPSLDLAITGDGGRSKWDMLRTSLETANRFKVAASEQKPNADRVKVFVRVRPQNPVTEGNDFTDQGVEFPDSGTTDSMIKVRPYTTAVDYVDAMMAARSPREDRLSGVSPMQRERLLSTASTGSRRERRSSVDSVSSDAPPQNRNRSPTVEMMRPKTPTGHVPSTYVPSNQTTEQTFVFDQVFRPTASQSEVYADIASGVVEGVVSGVNGSIICHGARRSGKTYTMCGPPGEDEGSLRGMLPRAVDHLFSLLEDDQMDFKILVTYLQIYNERYIDLLDPVSNETIAVLEDKESGVSVLSGVCEEFAVSRLEVLELQRQGYRFAIKDEKDSSSAAGHMIMRLSVIQQKKDDSAGKLFASLYLVDLGVPQKNMGTKDSIVCLGNVIEALTSSDRKHVPYRDSKLTRVLQAPLSGLFNTAMVCCVSPAKQCTVESLLSLRFGARCKKVRLQPKVNVTFGVKEYQMKVRDLEAQLETLQTVVQAKGWADCLSKDVMELTHRRDKAKESCEKLNAECVELMKHKDDLLIELQGTEATKNQVLRQLESLQAESARKKAEVAAREEELARISKEITDSVEGRRAAESRMKTLLLGRSETRKDLDEYEGLHAWIVAVRSGRAQPAGEDDGDHLAAVGDLESISTANKLLWFTSEAADSAACMGHLPVLKWLHEKKYSCTTAAMDRAAGAGRLDIVKWLHENREEGCTTRAMDWAARSGRLDVVKWLHNNRSEGCTIAAMDGAAASGHVQMLNWLLQNRSEGCSIHALDGAAASGNVAVMKWLSEHHLIPGGPSASAVAAAATNGHMNVLEWIKGTNEIFPVSIRAVEGAAQRGHLAILKWLDEQCVPDGAGCSELAVTEAAASGHMAVLEYFKEKHFDSCFTSRAVDCAAGSGHLQVAKWLASIGLKCTPDAYDLCAAGGHAGGLEWLFTTYGEEVRPRRALELAAGRGHVHIVKLLHKHAPAVEDTAPIASAASHGHLEVIKFLHSAGYAARGNAIDNAARGNHLETARWIDKTMGVTGSEEAMDWLAAGPAAPAKGNCAVM